MSALPLPIKEEPAEDSTSNEESRVPENGPLATEIVIIKMEYDQESPTGRIKDEPQEHFYSPAWKDTRENDWPPPKVEQWRPLCWQKVEIEHVSEKIEDDVADEQSNNVESDKPRIELKHGLPKWKCTPDGKFACTLCNKTYTTRGNIQRHHTVHYISPIQCRKCSKYFKTATQLRRHEKVHSTYDCEECGKVFKTSSNLFQHKRFHMIEKPFKCPLCFKEFTVKANLAKHQGKSRCVQHKAPITCQVCHKEFKTEYLLKSHLKRHSTEKPFCCDVCNTTLKHKTTLIRHLQGHNGDKPFCCEVCNKSFTHLSLLKAHVKIHSGEKPHKCPACSKTFAHKHNMKRHILRHRQEKKTVCDICNKKFPKESRLKYHMRTHLAEKHFKCFVCPKTFTHRQNVLRHYSKKHPNETYDCTDTDAQIATKVWQEHLNKLKLAENLETGRKENDDLAAKIEMKLDSEETLPDLDKPEQIKKKLTKIVAEFNKELHRNCDEDNVDNEKVMIKNEASDEFDSDEEVLATKLGNSENVKNHNNEIVSNKFVHNVNIVIKKEVTSDVEEMGNEIVSNERIADGNEIMAASNENVFSQIVDSIDIVVKKEVMADDKEILSDKEERISIFMPKVEIKQELDLV